MSIVVLMASAQNAGASEVFTADDTSLCAVSTQIEHHEQRGDQFPRRTQGGGAR